MTEELIEHNARQIRLTAKKLERYAKECNAARCRVFRDDVAVDNQFQNETVDDLLHTIKSHLTSLWENVEQEGKEK